jgi:photosynthetic reaction center H subunit
MALALALMRLRADVPDLLNSGAVKIRPMRMTEAFAIPDGDPNPIGCNVVGVDKQVGGTIVDVWVDQAESVIRYYEIKVSDEKAHARC